MGEHFHNLSAAARAVFDVAEDALQRDVRALCFRAPADALQRTENAQVAIVVTSLAALALAREAGVELGVVAGHSVGEISAIVASGALDEASGIELAARRGSLMGALPSIGGMVAIQGLSEEKLASLCDCARTLGPIGIAVFNAVGNTVISGTVQALEAVVQQAAEAGARTRPLHVSHAFHSTLMQDIHDEWAAVVAATPIHDPALRLVGNVGAQELTTAAAIREELVAQITHPVAWRQSMELLGGMNVADGLEIGDSRVLGGLARGENRIFRVASMGEDRTIRDILRKGGAR